MHQEVLRTGSITTKYTVYEIRDSSSKRWAPALVDIANRQSRQRAEDVHRIAVAKAERVRLGKMSKAQLLEQLCEWKGIGV
jgi:3-methyladenine DNA glycosylase/8-oxoguanine DNA glycosylase